jgi:hypothetical protein
LQLEILVQNVKQDECSKAKPLLDVAIIRRVVIIA